MKRLHAFFASFALFASFTFPIPARLTAQEILWRITTVAGTGTADCSGDGGPAAQAGLNAPMGVAVDAAGNLYIADFGNHRIRRVGKDGVIVTVAGMGTPGFSGDGGPAALAHLSCPTGVAVDAAGAIYIADTGNHRVRRVGPSGNMTTIAGVGKLGFMGDGGLAVQATLNSPMEVAVDAAGNVYIADTGNHRIRRVRPNGIITTVAGIGIFGLAGDGGPANQAALNFPTGVAVDARGNIYIADMLNRRVRRVGPDEVITTFAEGDRALEGEGLPARTTGLRWPWGVAVDAAGVVYVADQFSECVCRIGPEGLVTVVAGRGGFGFSGDGGPATQASLNSPTGVAVNAGGGIYIADKFNHRIRRVEAESTKVAGSPPLAGRPPR